MEWSRVRLALAAGVLAGVFGAASCGGNGDTTSGGGFGPGGSSSGSSSGTSKDAGKRDSGGSSSSSGGSSTSSSGSSSGVSSDDGGGDDGSADATTGDDGSVGGESGMDATLGTEAGSGQDAAGDSTTGADSSSGGGADAGSDSATTPDAGGGTDASSTPDAAADTGTAADAGSDATVTDGATPDGGAADAAADTGTGADAAADSPADAGVDATVDAGTDAAVDAGTTSDASADASDGAVACDLNGRWGSAITLNVQWVPAGASAAILAPGSGQIRQWVISTRVQTGTTVTDTAEVCGIELPDFSSTAFAGNELYGFTFPNAVFDAADGGTNLPGFTINGTMTNLLPGATYTSQQAAALIGLTMAAPTTTAWPAASTGITQSDEDHDTKPGVTADTKTDAGYMNIPVDFFRFNRADRLYLAIRQVTQINASLTDCNTVTGTVTVPQVPAASGNYALDSHVLGCRLAGTTTDCSTTGAGGGQAGFVDGNRPIFSPPADAGTAFPSTFTSVRMSASANCAAVRAQFP